MPRATGDPYWWSRAACAGEDVDIFYPPDSARGRRRESYVNVARTVCAPCGVQLECLQDALAHGEEFGIFGSCDMEKLDDEDHPNRRDKLRQWVADQLAERTNGNGSSPWANSASSGFTPSETQSW